MSSAATRGWIDNAGMSADPAVMERMNREQFTDFYQRTAPALRRYLARIAGNPDQADDLLQEAFVRLIHAAPAAEPQRRAYLYRTATNLAVDHFRKAERERSGLQMWKLSQGGAADPRHGTTGMEDIFQLLGARDRALLWLAYVEEASHAEIGAALGCGATSVRVLLFRARRRMARLLRERGINSGGRV